MKRTFINSRQLMADEKDIKGGGTGTDTPVAPEKKLQMNTGLGGDIVATEATIAAMVKPKEEIIEGVITSISKEIERDTPSGTRVFRMISILLQDGTVIARPVNKKFFDSNDDRLHQDAAVRCVFQETVAGKTQYILKDKENPQLPGIIRTHTGSGPSLNGVTKLSGTQTEVLNSAITDERFFKRQSRVAEHLGQYEKSPSVLNALAMVYAGQKLV